MTRDPLGGGPRVSVIVCTDGRRAELQHTIASLLTQSDPSFELLVVDNAPGTGHTDAVLAAFDDPRLRVIQEPRRGLSAARNRGVCAAAGDLIAFTDDDCLLDPGWLAALRQAFEADPLVSAVTGRTILTDLPTPVQQLFEEFGSFDRGSERLLWRWTDPRPSGLRPGASAAAAELPNALTRWAPVAAPPRIFPYAGVYGSGNNMAFSAAALARIGGFDEALGAGSPAGGGEDLDMFVRLMVAGEVLVYEPTAIVRHNHRHDSRTLRQQVRSYGSGLSAMITKQLLLNRASRSRIARRALPGLRHLFSSASPKNARKAIGFPRALTRIELFGLVTGPWLYLHGRRAVRRHGAASPAVSARPRFTHTVQTGPVQTALDQTALDQTALDQTALDETGPDRTGPGQLGPAGRPQDAADGRRGPETQRALVR